MNRVDRIDRARLAAAIQELTPMSNAATAVIDAIGDPATSLADLREVIQADAALTLRVLSMANSSGIGARQKVETVDHAAVLLGERTVVAAAVALGAKSLLAVPLEAYAVSGENLLASSVHAAVAARLLAAGISEVDPNVAFTAGLLRDAGKVVLSQLIGKIPEDVLGGDAPEVPDSPDSPEASGSPGPDGVEAAQPDFLEIERRLVGLDHCEVGAMVAEHYGLSDAQRAVIAYHHAPTRAPEAHRALVDVVHLADFVAMMVGASRGVDGMSYRVDEGAIERIGLEPAILETTMVETAMESESMLSMLVG